MKKMYIASVVGCLFLAACNNDSTRTGNVDDTAMTAPPAGQEMNQGQPGGKGKSGTSLTDTSYRIGDSTRK